MKTRESGVGLDEKVMQLIAERLEEGGKLPTEQQMARDFGVSRTMLRETLRRFEANGFIKSRRGSGHRAAMPDFTKHFRDAWSFVTRANPYMMLELLDIRMLLETSTLPAAMERLTGKRIETMGRLVKAMKEKAARGEKFVEEDQLYHRVLYETTGNTILEQLLVAFSDLYDTTHVKLPPAPDLELVAAQHEQTLEALAHGDLESATRLLKQQLIDVRGRILVYLMNQRQTTEKSTQPEKAKSGKKRARE